MRILLLTVAGMSSRFSESIGRSCIKCLYYKNSIKESLLYRMIQRHAYFDKIVIVGGFQYNELLDVIKKEFGAVKEKLIVVENKNYADYGSGYSLYLGYKAVEKIAFDELLFAEGDLFLDDETFDKICSEKKNVMTYNNIPIEADKSVVFYLSADGNPHYIYDTQHHILEIREPFKAIYNSGQVWKFCDYRLLKNVYDNMTQGDLQGTNLVPINAYFQRLSRVDYELIGFKKWINCNTVKDFEKSLEDCCEDNK